MELFTENEHAASNRAGVIRDAFDPGNDPRIVKFLSRLRDVDRRIVEGTWSGAIATIVETAVGIRALLEQGFGEDLSEDLLGGLHDGLMYHVDQLDFPDVHRILEDVGDPQIIWDTWASLTEGAISESLKMPQEVRKLPQEARKDDDLQSVG
jgi:hypothetical protein